MTERENGVSQSQVLKVVFWGSANILLSLDVVSLRLLYQESIRQIADVGLDGLVCDVVNSVGTVPSELDIAMGHLEYTHTCLGLLIIKNRGARIGYGLCTSVFLAIAKFGVNTQNLQKSGA